MSDPMPTTYESKTTTSSSGGGISLQTDYLRSIPGLLKIAEMALAFVVYICAIAHTDYSGANWIEFVALSSFFTVLSLFVLHLVDVLPALHRGCPFAVLALLVFICSIVDSYKGAGWVEFVSISAFITLLVMFIFYLIGLYGRLPGPVNLIEFIYYCVFTVFFIIAAIVAAVSAHWSTAIGFAAFFAFAATAVFAVDTFFQFRSYRTGQPEMVNTTVTTTTSAGAAQY